MVYVNVATVFGDGWEDEIIITTSRAMAKAILDSFSEGVVFVPSSPPEDNQEAIEAGIEQVTSSLNE